MTRTDSVLRTSHWAADRTTPLLETSIGDVLRAAAERAPDALALVAGTPDPAGRRGWSYAQMLVDAERAARALLGRFAPGERVAVCAHNIPEWVVLEYAAALAGLTLVTVNPANRADELRHVLGHSGAAGVFVVDEWRGNPLAATVAELANRLGYRSEAAFARAFKRVVGVAPGSVKRDAVPDIGAIAVALAG